MAGESEKGESGVVVEYFSQEMGFVKLDSEDGLVVLFHLNQVVITNESLGFHNHHRQMWEEKDKQMVLLKDVQEEPLHSLLPLGSPVMLVYRRLPAHNVSAFRWGVIKSCENPELSCINDEMRIEMMKRMTTRRF